MLERLGLGARLALLGLGAALLVSVAGGWVLRGSVHETVLRSAEQDLARRTERVQVHLRPEADGSIAEDRNRSADEFSAIFSGWYWQLDAGGRTLRSRSLWDSQLPLDRAEPVRPPLGLLRLPGPRGEHLVGIVRSLQLEHQTVQLAVFGPALELDTELARLDRVLLITQLVLIGVLLLASFAQVRWGLRPLRRLHGALSSVRAGTAERIGTGHGPDLDPLAQEMDEVLTHNARIVSRVRHHAADLSHALKKPLALLGAEAQSAQVRGELVRAEVATMSRMIDRHLARAGSGAGERRRITLEEPLTALVGLMRRLHGARELAWQLDVPAELRWRGEPTDLEEMLGNLLDNAGKWAATQVRISGRKVNRSVAIVVEDDGPGIPAEAIGEAARRGRRFDEATEGSGLGLAIVSDIAETYGGDLTLDVSPLGGLRTVLTLPD